MDISNKQEFAYPEKFVDKTKKAKKMSKSKSVVEDYRNLDVKYPEENIINLDEKDYNFNNDKIDIENNCFFNEYFDDYKENNYDFYKEYDRGRYLPEAKEYFNRKKGKKDCNDYLYKLDSKITNDFNQYYNRDNYPNLEGTNFLDVKDGIINSKGRTVLPADYSYDIIDEPGKSLEKTEKVNDYVGQFYLEPFERVVNVNNEKVINNINNKKENKKVLKKKIINIPKIPDFFKE